MEKHDEVIRIVTKILEFRRQHPNRLDHAAAQIVKSSLPRLRELGLSNREIFEALGGAWSEVAIKQMTAGVPVKDPEARRSFGQVLHEIAKTGYTGDDLKRLHPVVRSRIDPNLIMEFLENVVQSKMDPVETLLLYARMKDKGISPEIAARVNATTESLSSCGYTMVTLEKFKKASMDYKPDELLESIAIYRGLDKLKLTNKEQVVQNNEFNSQLRLKSGEIEKIEQQLLTMKDRIAKTEYLTSIGYTDQVLESNIKIIKKFGQPREFLEGLNTYPNMNAMKEKLLEIQKQYSDEESRLKTKKAEHVHFATELVMVNELLDLGMSIPAIAKFLEMVRKLGLPESVFTAITSYGSVDNLEKRKRVLESLIGELETRYSSLQEMTDKANKEHLHIQKMMEGDVDLIKLAKVILAVTFSPKKKVEFGMGYAILCLMACQKICRGIDVKKTVRVQDILGNKYPTYSYAEFEVQDLLYMALSGLFACDSQGVAA